MVRGGLPELTPLQGCEVERDGACEDLGDGCEVERDGVCEDLGDEPSGLKGQAALRRSGVFPRPRGQGGGEWQGGSGRAGADGHTAAEESLTARGQSTGGGGHCHSLGSSSALQKSRGKVKCPRGEVNADQVQG